eukprot:scaffold45677_cov27-Phaeocystis_antarctica.AAC.1
MSARATSTLPGQPICRCGIYIELADLHSTRSEKLRTVSRASKSFAPKSDKRKGSGVYGGLHFKSRALTNYLRRRSPGPPFPPDHRQAGERGAMNALFSVL